VVTGRLRAAPGPIIERFFGGRECFFVQIGSYDGVTGDPLHPLILANPQWRGILVEPQTNSFLHLKGAYGARDGLAFENVAIADTRGLAPLYSLSGDSDLVDRILDFNVFASFRREHTLEHLAAVMRLRGIAGDPASHLAETLVQCESLTSVLDRHRVERIDLFHVNAEGHDYAIIRQIDFRRFQPTLIMYEHGALGAETEVAALAFLRQNGYRTVNCGILNTVAVRR
jgi:FkbM family methyltransferase